MGQELIDVNCITDSRKSLCVVCSDGINVYVGKDGGVIRYLELNVGRPLPGMDPPGGFRGVCTSPNWLRGGVRPPRI